MVFTSHWSANTTPLGTEKVNIFQKDFFGLSINRKMEVSYNMIMGFKNTIVKK